MAKRSYTVKATKVERVTAITGGNVSAHNVSSIGDQNHDDTEVTVEIQEARDSIVITSPGIIEGYGEPGYALRELSELLIQNLAQQDEVDDLKEVIAGLQAQLSLGPEERNTSKIKRLLESVGTYIGLASLLAKEANQAKALFDAIKGALLGG